MPVKKFAWNRYNECWSPEIIDHSLVCADQDAPAGLSGAVFAVGTSRKEALINVRHILVLHSTAATIYQDIAILTVTATVLIH